MGLGYGNVQALLLLAAVTQDFSELAVDWWWIVHYVFHMNHLGWVAYAEANSAVRLIIARISSIL
jgi:hypothetical protein